MKRKPRSRSARVARNKPHLPKFEVKFIGTTRFGAEKAKVYGEELVRIRSKYGELTKDNLIEEASSETNVFHDQFTWDDSIAGPAYRRMQAADLLRKVKIRIIREDRPEQHIVVRAFSADVYADSVEDASDEDNERNSHSRVRYEETILLMKDPRKQKMLLEQALGELNAWRIRYSQLEELASMFSAISKEMREVMSKAG